MSKDEKNQNDTFICRIPVHLKCGLKLVTKSVFIYNSYVGLYHKNGSKVYKRTVKMLY